MNPFLPNHGDYLGVLPYFNFILFFHTTYHTILPIIIIHFLHNILYTILYTIFHTNNIFYISLFCFSDYIKSSMYRDRDFFTNHVIYCNYHDKYIKQYVLLSNTIIYMILNDIIHKSNYLYYSCIYMINIIEYLSFDIQSCYLSIPFSHIFSSMRDVERSEHIAKAEKISDSFIRVNE
jgi:hypothetical protein